MKYTVEIGGALLLAALAVSTATAAAAPLAGSAAPSVHSAARNGARTTPQRVPGYLGLGFRDSNGHGVEIIVIDHDGPAGKAGLRLHDVIVSMNGQPIANSDGFSRMIHESAPGVTAALVVQRDGQPLKMTLQIADRSVVERTASVRVAAETVPDQYDPPVAEYSSGDTAGAPPASKATGKNSQSLIGQVLHLTPFTGLALQTLEPQLADFFGASQGIGLLVQQVAPNSPAAFCGLRAGDVVLRADSMPIKSASDWGKHLRANQGQPIVLNILRDHHEMNLTLTPESRKHTLVEWPQIFKSAE
jgi:serine protease Do